MEARGDPAGRVAAPGRWQGVERMGPWLFARGLAAWAVGVAAAGGAQALTLDPVGDYALEARLSSGFTNFHPQGLGYDPFAGRLLFVQQSSQRIYATDLTGTILDTGPATKVNATAAGATATHYYYADYTGNSLQPDLWRVPKAGGTTEQVSAEIAAVGGYPIDVRAGRLYRTEPTTGAVYTWGTLETVRISSLATPDVIDRVLTLETAAGIGDLAVDLDNNALWTLDYSASATIRRFDLSTGVEVESFALGLDGLTAGLTYADGRLYHYDWIASGSRLRVWDLGQPPSSSVPLPASGLMLGAAAALGLAMRRRRGA